MISLIQLIIITVISFFSLIQFYLFWAKSQQHSSQVNLHLFKKFKQMQVFV